MLYGNENQVALKMHSVTRDHIGLSNGKTDACTTRLIVYRTTCFLVPLPCSRMPVVGPPALVLARCSQRWACFSFAAYDGWHADKNLLVVRYRGHND